MCPFDCLSDSLGLKIPICGVRKFRKQDVYMEQEGETQSRGLL